MAITHNQRQQGNIISGTIIESTADTAIDEAVSCPAGHFLVLLGIGAMVDDGTAQLEKLQLRGASDAVLLSMSGRMTHDRAIRSYRCAPVVTDVDEDVKLYADPAGTATGNLLLSYSLLAVPKGTPPSEWAGI